MAETVSYRYFGDIERARSMVGFGNLQLSILKRQMELGGLDQYRRVVTLSDGTSVLCTSVFGISTINIFAPVVPVAVVEKEEKEAEKEKNIFFAYGVAANVRIYTETCKLKKEFSTGLSANVHVESMDDRYLHVVKYDRTSYYKKFDYEGNEKSSMSFPMGLEFACGWYNYCAITYTDSGSATVMLYKDTTLVASKTYSYGEYYYYIPGLSISAKGVFILIDREHNTTSLTERYIEQCDLKLNTVAVSTLIADSVEHENSYRVPHSNTMSAYELEKTRIMRVFNWNLSNYTTFDIDTAIGTTKYGNGYLLGIIENYIYYTVRDYARITRIYKFDKSGNLLKERTLPDVITGGGSVAQIEETKNV